MSGARFEVGQRVWAQSAGDHNCVWWFEVVRRSAKFVTLREDSGEVHRVGVKADERGEWVLPFGSYSLAPVVRACRTADDLPPSLRHLAFVPDGLSAGWGAPSPADLVAVTL
jgi:hypothetical protein